MKLVYIITGLSSGGAEAMLLKLLNNFDRSRINLTVISLTTTGTIGPRIEELGIPVHALLMQPNLPSPYKFFQLIEILFKLKPDIVHTHMYHSDLLGGLAARLSGVKALIWGIHHSDLSKDKNKKSTLWVVRLCAEISRWIPHAILSCSERAKALHIDAGYSAKSFSVISNGFDLSLFVPDLAAKASVRSELKLGSDALLVGMIARVHPQKNHEGFIRAAVKVANAIPNVHFLLAGSGVDGDNNSLMNMIKKTEMPERFHLLGLRDDIPRLMAALDVLASSSWGEAFPNVLGEAMACCVPCVVTDVGDSAEIVGDTGRVVMPGDMDGLAAHLIELLGQPVLRSFLGQRGCHRVKERYEIGNIARKYEKFYVELLGRI